MTDTNEDQVDAYVFGDGTNGKDVGSGTGWDDPTADDDETETYDDEVDIVELACEYFKETAGGYTIPENDEVDVRSGKDADGVYASTPYVVDERRLVTTQDDDEEITEDEMRSTLRPDVRRSRGGRADPSTLEEIVVWLQATGIELTCREEHDIARTAGELWSSARDAYDAAATPGNDKAHARWLATRALEAETEWMDVKRSTQTDDPQDLWYLDEDEGRYVKNVSRVKDRMATELKGKSTATEVNHVKHFLQSKNGVSDEKINAGDEDATLIPLKNGVLNIDAVEYDPNDGIDIDDVTLEEPRADQYWTYQIETKWDPENADFSGFDDWLARICPDENDRQIFCEFAGHSIHPGYPVDGFLVVRGPGGSGKSQALEVIGNTIGENSISRSKLHKIEGNRFELAQVVDKTVNIDKDLEGTKLTSMAKLKHLAAGEEMSCELKGVDAYKAANSATMLMAADNPPQFPQRNRALGRRLYSIEFPCEFVDNPSSDNPFELQSRPKPDVEAELRSDERCQAALVRAVEGLVAILATGKFSSPYAWKERVERYESDADPIADAGRTLLVRDEDGVVHGDDVKAGYDRLADDKAHPDKSKQAILQTLGRFTFTDLRKERTRSFTPGREKDTIYHGMAFTDKAKERYLPDDAHWDAYGGRPGADEDETGDAVDIVTLDDVRSMEPCRLEGSVKVTVGAALDPRPWLASEYVVKDDTDTVRVQSISDEVQRLKEGATYVIESATVIPDDGDNQLQLVPVQTEIRMVEDGTRDDEQEAVDSDDDGNGALESKFLSTVNTFDDGKGARINQVVDRVVEQHGASVDRVQVVMNDLLEKGEVSKPVSGHLRLTSDVPDDEVSDDDEPSKREHVLELAREVHNLDTKNRDGAPVDELMERVNAPVDRIETTIGELKHSDDAWEPATGFLRVEGNPPFDELRVIG